MLFEMGEKAAKIAPSNVEEKIYNEIIDVIEKRKNAK
jgi:hypothetical protein